jgi:glycosyltransferase involved in cell wall biosynthesis
MATFNSEATVEASMESLLTQSVPLEVVVVDGKSSDGTMRILDRYRDRIAALLSEPDEGVYDALNKGIALASGEYIYILGSDDVLAHDYALADLLAAGDFDVIYGSVWARSVHGVVRPTSTLPLSRFKYQMPFSHQGVLVRRELIAKEPFGNTLASDYRQLFRLYLEGARFKKVESQIAVFSMGGISDRQQVRSTIDRLLVNIELRRWRAVDVFAFYAAQISVCYLKPRLMRLLGRTPT